ncbi:hypothetical protein [Brevibacterium aurantiacum]|uniref:hypothetical protein n=1 Tax=Brevibacterium aurantiacum TaxID=273384 RepID=UPI0014367428|nr:hypothetical protein [Brevibacterium aurantiacum]
MTDTATGAKGGAIPLHGKGATARRCVEADHSGADEYRLGADSTIAEPVGRI